jgi:hypothetical protein
MAQLVLRYAQKVCVPVRLVAKRVRARVQAIAFGVEWRVRMSKDQSVALIERQGATLNLGS